MFKKILVANRGEIALRVMSTCREMGISTVAVYSDADRKALHTLCADEAVYLGGSEPAASYLNIEKIVSAAIDSGAEAIHPGYGFLAENPDLADRCEEKKLVFIGPPARVIRELGDKTVARRIMLKAGVPVIPGLTHAEPDPVAMAREAQKVGYPVLIKAAAGGGGKGMRIVATDEEMDAACAEARSEAKAAFGNGTVYLEKFLERPRHVEFQILADTQGNAIHLLERECSIQRRHQKIIEESPSPAMTPELRAEMGRAAVAAATASGYVNAGTVEFLLDDKGKYYFLEVNTRLQVEHPVTEMITGIDIVRQQIRIAAGNPLTLSQDHIMARGHAIESRIYAEDAENNFFPCPGKIVFMKEPTGPGIRNDCGVYSGFDVPVEYDPILSKLIVCAENRTLAVERMINALQQYMILGIKTSIPFLIDVIASEPFQQGVTFTDFIATHFCDWKQQYGQAEVACMAYVIDEICRNRRLKSFSSGEAIATAPWQTLGNWRL
jgi:acetyl-CoA carboxylase biotin carboxylase subunit